MFLGTSGLGPKFCGGILNAVFFNIFYNRWINYIYKLYKQATIAL
jgi:hypothetical protein